MERGTEKQKIPAVVLGSHKLGLGVIRALGERGVPVFAVYYNPNDMGYVSKYVVKSYFSPHPDHDENGFVNLLIDLARTLKGSVLMPSDDPTLMAASKNKKLLEKHYKMACENWDVCEKFLVKKYTYEIASKANIPHPRTLTTRRFRDAEDFAEAVGYPCILKPSLGHTFFELFRRKMIIARDSEELKAAFRIVENRGMEMLLQELIPGDDTHGFNYNTLAVNGSPVAEFTARKLRLSPPATGFPRAIVSRRVPELREFGEKMLSAVRYTGYSCMEFKKDARDGVYKLMEVNARQNLSTSLAVKCGINFPYITYLYTLYGILPVGENMNFEEGVYWIDLERDLVETIKSHRIEKIKFLDFLKPYLKKKAFSLLSIDDPLPFVKRMADALKASTEIFGETSSKEIKTVFSGQGKQT